MTKKKNTHIFDENGNPISRDEWIAIFDSQFEENNNQSNSKTNEKSRQELIEEKKAEAKKKFDELLSQAKAEVPGVKEQVKKTSEKVKDAGWIAVAVTTTVFKNIKKK